MERKTNLFHDNNLFTQLALAYFRRGRDIRHNRRGAMNIPPGPPGSPWLANPQPGPGGTDPALDGSGTFAAGVPIIIPPNRVLICFAASGFTATLTGNFRNGKTIAYPAFSGVGAAQRFSGSVFQSVTPSAADADIYWFTVPDGPFPPFDSFSGGVSGGLNVTGAVVAQSALASASLTSVDLLDAGTTPDELIFLDSSSRLTLRGHSTTGPQPVYLWLGLASLNLGTVEGTALFGVNATTGLIITYAGNATSGKGIPALFGAGPQSLYTNVAPTTLSYTPPTVAGVYRISGYLDILTGGTMTVQLKVTYHDPGGIARTDIPVLTQQNSTTLLAGSPGANATGRFWFVMIIAIDNSGTAITIGDNAGTYTAGTYYWDPVLEQLA